MKLLKFASLIIAVMLLSGCRNREQLYETSYSGFQTNQSFQDSAKPKTLSGKSDGTGTNPYSDMPVAEDVAATPAATQENTFPEGNLSPYQENR